MRPTRNQAKKGKPFQLKMLPLRRRGGASRPDAGRHFRPRLRLPLRWRPRFDGDIDVAVHDPAVAHIIRHVDLLARYDDSVSVPGQFVSTEYPLRVAAR